MDSGLTLFLILSCLFVRWMCRYLSKGERNINSLFLCHMLESTTWWLIDDSNSTQIVSLAVLLDH